MTGQNSSKIQEKWKSFYKDIGYLRKFGQITDAGMGVE